MFGIAPTGGDDDRIFTLLRVGAEEITVLGTILLVVLVLLLIGAIPTWPHSRSWGYGPSGGIGLVVIILVVLLVSGRL
jgi:hypothetical protein